MASRKGGRRKGDSYAGWDTHTSTKRAWSAKEDAHLRELVAQHGTTKWSTVADELKCRSGKQCRERWHNHLNPDVVKGGWTEEEDAIILRMQAELGNQWAKITKMLPGRTDNAVKNRWHSSMRSKTTRKSSDVSDSEASFKENQMTRPPPVHLHAASSYIGPIKASSISASPEDSEKRVLSPSNSMWGIPSPPNLVEAAYPVFDRSLSPLADPSTSEWPSMMLETESLRMDPVLNDMSPGDNDIENDRTDTPDSTESVPHFSPIELTDADMMLISAVADPSPSKRVRTRSPFMVDYVTAT